MPINHAVLGLLADGPSYGYELKASFEQAIGPQWGELNIGHLYQVLDRLVRDGFVTRRPFPQTDRPDRVVYRLTRQGRVELQRWLSEPTKRQAGYRDDFFLKLFVASKSGASALRQVARTQRESYIQELATLWKLRKRRANVPLIGLLVEAAVLHTKASLRVAEIAEEEADTLAKAARQLSGDRRAAESEEDDSEAQGA